LGYWSAIWTNNARGESSTASSNPYGFDSQLSLESYVGSQQTAVRYARKIMTFSGDGGNAKTGVNSAAGGSLQ